MVGTAFDHRDSRALTRGCTRTCRDESCTSRRQRMADFGLPEACSAPRVGPSEVYNSVLSDVLTEALGWGWKSIRRLHFRSRSTKLSAFSEGLQKAFSTRSSAIEVVTNAMTPAFVVPFGHVVCTDDIWYRYVQRYVGWVCCDIRADRVPSGLRRQRYV